MPTRRLKWYIDIDVGGPDANALLEDIEFAVGETMGAAEKFVRNLVEEYGATCVTELRHEVIPVDEDDMVGAGGLEPPKP